MKKTRSLITAPGRSVTFIGMPGSGKSAVGRILAERLGWEFIDTDKCIERRHRLPLQALIDKVGEGAFRTIEEESILAIHPPQPRIISTGGSVVYSPNAMAHLASLSVIVFLDASLDNIRSHILSEAPRGIVGMTDGGLELLYRERVPLYRRYADLVVTIESESPEEISSKVLAKLCAADAPGGR